MSSHLRGLDRLRVLRKVGLVLVLPVRALVPRVRGEVVDPLEDLASQRPREVGGSGGMGASLCRRCNNRHFGECRQVSSGYYTCGHTGHLAKYYPQNLQRLQPPQQTQQPSLPPPVQTQQFSGPSGYVPTGRGGAYHYQGDPVPYASGQYQYPQDPYQQSGYGHYSGGYMPYQQSGMGQYSAGGSQWQSGGQPQPVDVAASSARSSRQHSQAGQGRNTPGSRCSC